MSETAEGTTPSEEASKDDAPKDDAPKDATQPIEHEPEIAGLDVPGPVRMLEPSEIRARRRPWAIAFVFIFELVGALLIATPVHSWAKIVFGGHPDGDAVVFRPGGHALLSWLGEDDPTLPVVVRTTLVLFLALAIVGQLVTGTLIASLATGVGARGRRPPLRFALRAGARAFVPLAGITAISMAVEILILAIAVAAATAVDGALENRLGDARAFQWCVVTFAVLFACALVLGVVLDLARVAIARDSARRLCTDEPTPGAAARIGAGLRSAALTARRSIGRAVIAWGWRAVIGVLLLVLGARAGDWVSGRGGAILWLLFGIHQAILVTRAGLRASWLARALRLI